MKERQTESLHDNDLTSSGVNVSINKFNRATVRDTQYLDEAGNVDWEKWAPNNGNVTGTTKAKQTLGRNTIIDRYGDTYGAYVSPIGIPYQQRSLPYIESTQQYHRYIVIEPIQDVVISQIAPAFGEPGGGTQYKLPKNIRQLIKEGYIKEIRDETK